MADSDFPMTLSLQHNRTPQVKAAFAKAATAGGYHGSIAGLGPHDGADCAPKALQTGPGKSECRAGVRSRAGDGSRLSPRPAVKALILVSLLIVATVSATQISVDDSFFDEELLGSLIVPVGVSLTWQDVGTLDVEEDLVIGGNVTIIGSATIVVGDDVWIGGTIEVLEGLLEIHAADTVRVDGSVYSVNGGLKLSAAESLELGGVVHVDGIDETGAGQGVNLSAKDVTVAGWIQAGRGAPGGHIVLPGGVNGLSGGQGGDIEIVATESITADAATLIAGDGGPGGPGAGSVGGGGKGGDGGIVSLTAETVRLNVSIASARGGDGGSAVAVGSALDEAKAGDGGRGGEARLSVGPIEANLAAGAWNLTVEDNALQVSNFTRLTYGPALGDTSSAAGIAYPGAASTLIGGLSSRAPAEAQHHGIPALIDFCGAIAAADSTRPATTLFEGGAGGDACAEGATGPPGQPGAAGRDSQGPLDQCTGGGAGNRPVASGADGGQAWGGRGGDVLHGASGPGGHAMSFGGAGGDGGDGGRGGDASAADDGCPGGDGGAGSDGGSGGHASPGFSGDARCGYIGSPGGAGSVGGPGGRGGIGGRGGAPGPIGSPGTDGLVGSTGASGWYTAGSSGSQGTGGGGPACLSFVATELNDGPVSWSIDDLPNAVSIAPKLGWLYAPAVVTGTVELDWMGRDGSVLMREAFSGPEVEAWGNSSFLVGTEPVSPVLEALSPDDAYQKRDRLWFFESTTHYDIVEALDWRQRGYSGGLFDEGGYESDHFTYEVRCGAPANGGSAVDLGEYWDGLESASPCPSGQDGVKTSRKLPLNLRWDDNYGIALAQVEATFTANEFDVDCDGGVRAIEVFYEGIDDPVLVGATQEFARYSWGIDQCDDQDHVRVYEVLPDLILGQAHFEHRHWLGHYEWYGCNGVTHCVHWIQAIEYEIAEIFRDDGWDMTINGAYGTGDTTWRSRDHKDKEYFDDGFLSWMYLQGV